MEQKNTETVPQNRSELEESLIARYRKGRWYIGGNTFRYTFDYKNPVIQLELDLNGGKNLCTYLPQFDKVGILGREPTERYFERKAYLYLPGVHYDINDYFSITKNFRKLCILFGSSGQYSTFIARGIGQQLRVVELLERILKKTDISLKIMRVEQNHLNRQLERLYAGSSMGL